MVRRYIISVIGSGASIPGSPEYEMAEKIGYGLIDHGYRVLTGGLGGIMEAALKGARSSPKHRDGDTLAILPGMNPDDANQYADIVIPTGLGIGRNIIVTSSDAIIAIGGGSGTLSEIAFAWQKGRPIITLDIDGWSGRIGDGPIDERGGTIMKAKDPDETLYLISHIFEEKDIR